MAQFNIKGIKLHIPDRMINDALRRSLKLGRYESAELAAIKKNINEADRVLELGAGAGYLAINTAQHLPVENITLIEANPEMVPVIKDNIKRNGLAEINVINAAVVADNYQSDTISFHLRPAFWASSILPAKSENKRIKAVEIPAARFSDLMQQHKPTVVIMDIEGGEDGLFETLWPDHIRLLIIELHPLFYGAAVIKRIFDTMSKSGFTYAPFGSRGKIVVFKRLQDSA